MDDPSPGTDTTPTTPEAVLAPFSEPVRGWFTATFAAPTPAQTQGWPAIAAGDHTLILAPTGSGKTLTAFLSAIDRLVTDPVAPAEHRLKVVYVSPLKALAVDVDRNLRAPLEGIRLAAERAGLELHRPVVGVRTGDTPAHERERLRRHPPDVLITTPESLYLVLTSRARTTLRSVHTVIVDEIHALAPTKRGSHLALCLERLEHEVTRGGLDATEPDRPAPQRIALSATQRPLEEMARFLGGFRESPRSGRLEPRPVSIVDAGATKPLELEVVVPVEDMADLGGEAEPGRDLAISLGSATTAPARRSIWPAIHPRLLDLVLAHRSTLVFVNARRQAERLAAKLNELYAHRLHQEEPPELVKAHHGSLSRERRIAVEDELKAGKLRGLVATSSLELGIDMGAVDLVVQVASPGAVARGLQRIGRAGHGVGEPSRGVLFPRYRGDLIETAVVVRGMHAGEVEAISFPRSPLDVLAQQIVAMVAVESWAVETLARVLRRAAPYEELSDEMLHAVLDLLAGRYPSEEFSELRPRIVWDRVEDVLHARSGTQRLAVTNPGTIPDRGLYGVFLPDGTRVGELDEEMVHESRAGETFVLGASTWRIDEITHERVVVVPAPGEPGKLPFWHGDGPGRPAELGAAIGAFQRQVHEHAASDRGAEIDRLRAEHDLDAWAAANVVAYLDEQVAATGTLPDDRTIVVERFRDELGDWRICLLSPYGARVHAPWAMAIERRLIATGYDPEVIWADDGIVLRLQEAVDELPLEAIVPEPEDVEELVVEQLAGTALFTTLFREAAGRALLLPKRQPGRRTALWQQRQRAAELLRVAARYPSFPLLLETTRECLRDVFDLPALTSLLADVRARRIRIVPVETASASPFAQSLLFGWVGQYMYEYDAPLAERRAAALALDRDLLRELLGGDELRELLDAAVIVEVERELQRLPDDRGPGDRGAVDVAAQETAYERRARDADELHDLLRTLGALTRSELAERSTRDPAEWITELVAQRRAIELHVAGEERVAAAEDAARLRDALGTALPPGLPSAFTTPVEDPLAELVARHARTHGPFTADEVATRLDVPRGDVEAALSRLIQQDRVLVGAFRPDGVEREWVDPQVLRRIKRRSLAALRSEVEPVEPAALGRFLPAWQQVRTATGQLRRGADALAESLVQLQGAPLPASVLEADVLPARVDDYRPALLDELVATGEVVWLGVEPLGSRDGRVVVCFRDQVHLVAPEPAGEPPDGALHTVLRDELAVRGASFWPQLVAAAGPGTDEGQLLAALWDLVWAGEVTNDTYAPVRAFTSRRAADGATRRGPRRPARGVRAVPRTAVGRWSLVRDLVDVEVAETERAHAIAEQLIDRHGVLTRESLRAEGIRGGFAAVYPVLKAMEEAGRVRRGYLVAGLGAAQFAAPGALERLRSARRGAVADGEAREREDGTAWPTVVLAATDPAQPYGAALPWPASSGRPARSAGSFVVLVDGAPAALLERGGRSLVTFEHPAPPSAWLPELTALVDRGRLRRLEIVRVDGTAIHDAPDWCERLEQAGFTAGYRGLVHRG